jgi:hypothetical protein
VIPLVGQSALAFQRKVSQGQPEPSILLILVPVEVGLDGGLGIVGDCPTFVPGRPTFLDVVQKFGVDIGWIVTTVALKALGVVNHKSPYVHNFSRDGEVAVGV